MVDLKFPPVLKMAIYSMSWETYLYLSTLDSTGNSSAPMWRIRVMGIHKLADTVSFLPRYHKPRTLSSLCCVITVYGVSELELKVICVIGKSTIFLLVVSFVMKKKNKRYSYDAVIAYTEEHGNRAAEWHFGPPQMEKKPFVIGRLVKNNWKKLRFSEILKVSFRFYKLRFF